MADDPNELRLPFSMTIPWKRTKGGRLWPVDRKGRYWPSSRMGDPERPFHDYKVGEVVPARA